MSPILPISLAAVIAASVVLPAQAAQPDCLTNEIESELIDSRLALGAGLCHLDAMASSPDQALAHAQYAYSWFVRAEQEQAGSAAEPLQLVRQRLQALERQGRAPALTAQNSH